MTQDANAFGDTIAGVALGQVVVLDLLIDAGVLKPEQVEKHLTDAIDRMKSFNFPPNRRLFTETMLQRFTAARSDRID